MDSPCAVVADWLCTQWYLLNNGWQLLYQPHDVDSSQAFTLGCVLVGFWLGFCEMLQGLWILTCHCQSQHYTLNWYSVIMHCMLRVCAAINSVRC